MSDPHGANSPTPAKVLLGAEDTRAGGKPSPLENPKGGHTLGRKSKRGKSVVVLCHLAITPST